MRSARRPIEPTASSPARERERPRVAGPSDADLLAAVARGSEPAFNELRRRYRHSVEAVCRSVACEGSEDCAQEAFARVWQKAGLFDPARGTAAAWLLTVTRNTARTHSIRQAAGPRVLAEPLENTPAKEGEPAIDRFWLEAALERLPTHERQVLELAYWSDRSQSQIAAELGVPLGTVKTWTRRGLNRLATLLGDEVIE